MAYILVAMVSCQSLNAPDAGIRLRRATWLLVAFGATNSALQLAVAWGLISIPLINPWYWDRLRGWSENPNQLALVCAILGFVSLHLAETARRLVPGVAAVASAALSFYVGFLTKSDALLLVMIVGYLTFSAVKVGTWMFPLGGPLTLRSASAWIGTLSLPLILAVSAPSALPLAGQAQELATNMFKADHEGEVDTRLNLWAEALSRGIDSGMLGLGPGAHIVRTPYKREIPPNFEAHNTLLDVFTQGGALAVGSVVWLMGTTLLTTLRARQAALAALVCGLLVFSTFHLIVRLPIFWFAITMCLVTAPAVGQVSAVRQRT
jgi:hypothetical protein